MDPFKSVLEDAEQQLSTAQLQLRQFHHAPSVEKQTDLHNTLQDLAEVVNELTESINAVKQRPERFNLQQHEIDQRIEQVGHINRQVNDIQQELSKIKADKSYPPPGGTGGTTTTTTTTSDTQEVSAEDRQMLFQQTIQEQDQMFDDVAQTVANLREQADIMSRELEDQADLIDDFEVYVDNTNDRLRRGIKRVDYVLRNNRDCMSSCCIGVLIVVLIVLLVLVVIT